MSIFGSIWSKISGHHAASAQPQAAGQPPAAGQVADTTQQAASSPASVVDPEPTAAPPISSDVTNSVGGAGSPSVPSPSAQPTGAGAGSVDVAAVLTDLAGKKSERLDWRHSIVDLLKVLDLDSSLTARKSLAHELGYSGDTGDSASMNMWLHKEVMTKLAANGGKVPADLQD